MGNSASDEDDRVADEDQKLVPAELIMGADKSENVASSVDTNAELNEDLLAASVPEIEQIPVVFRFLRKFLFTNS
jgi:hypothetical protein